MRNLDDSRDAPLACVIGQSAGLLATTWTGRNHPVRNCRPRRGAMLALLAILMVAFMVVAALSIDIAQVHLARTELRTATDAAAKAAAENFSRTSDPVQARRRGIEIAAQNQVMGRRLLLAEENFEFGYAAEENETGRFVFFADRFPKNSVRVTGARTGAGRDGAVPLLLGSILGRDFFETHASATAIAVERDVVLMVSTLTAK